MIVRRKVRKIEKMNERKKKTMEVKKKIGP